MGFFYRRDYNTFSVGTKEVKRNHDNCENFRKPEVLHFYLDFFRQYPNFVCQITITIHNPLLSITVYCNIMKIT